MEGDVSCFDGLFDGHAHDRTALIEFRKYCAVDEGSSSYLDSLPQGNLMRFICDVFKAVLDGIDKQEESFALTDDQKRFRKLTLQCLVNAANRSKRLRECIDAESVHFFRAMLRLEAFRDEVLACLVAFARPLHRKAALCSEYSDLLNDIALLWRHSSTTAGQRSWISALVSIHLEEDYAFLAECLADMEDGAFTELLVITEALLDHLETGQCVQIHSNNARFCVILLERIELEIGTLELPSGDECADESRRTKLKFDVVERLSSLVSIISSLALRRPQFDPIFHDDTTATTIVAHVLEAIVDYEIMKENAVVCVAKAPDRPMRPKQSRREAVKLPFVRNLSALLRRNVASEEQIASLKCMCVRALGNLCCESASNQSIVGKQDGVLLLLHCARRLDTDSPFIMQWAIAAVRHVCMGCPENQQRLAEIEQCPSGVVDRDRLLLQLNLRAVFDSGTGKIRLERIS
ncbi:Ataxin-10 [Toxocara canis]|uniref:Ataxin-10 n=1 Tax=Toxocara canis TaxID=6265 RepID=A0A0B2VGC1_TOXCA|nr:Ataxin-10 [Toxocara canis]